MFRARDANRIPKLDGPRRTPTSGGPARQLVILLHGYGADGEDLIGLAPYMARLVPDAEFVSPNAPEPCAMQPMGRQWWGIQSFSPEERLLGARQAAPILDAFIDRNAGKITPDHKVFLLKERIAESQAIEEERKREEERKAKEAEERKKRQLAKLEELKAKVASLQGILDQYGECPMMVEMGGTDMGMMVLEQAQMVVEAEEIDMAADVMTFIDEVMPQLEMLVPECQGGAAAPAGDGAAPAEAAPATEEPAPAPEGGE